MPNQLVFLFIPRLLQQWHSSGSQAASPGPSPKSSNQSVNRIGAESKSGSQFRKKKLVSKKQRRLSKKGSSQSEISNDKQPNHSGQCGSSSRQAIHFEFVMPSRGHIFSSSKSGSSLPKTYISSQSERSNSFPEKSSQSGKCGYCNKGAFPSGSCKSNPEHIFFRPSDFLSGKLHVVKEPTVSLDNGHSSNEERLPSETERSDCSELLSLNIVPSSPTKEYYSAGESTSESKKTLRNETSARSCSKSSEGGSTSNSEKTLRNESSARSHSKSSARKNTSESKTL